MGGARGDVVAGGDAVPLRPAAGRGGGKEPPPPRRYTFAMRPRRSAPALLMLIALAIAAGGCGGSPFVDEGPVRSPFDRYQTLRGERRQKTTIDSFGRERPALRVRLAPLDSE